MSRRSFALAAAGLLPLVWLLFFWDLGAVPFFDVGEPREALQVVEGIDHGAWILPLRNGTELPSKPPLFHWLANGAALWLGRVDELAVRLPSAVLAALTVALVVWFGARRWDAAAGLFAGAILATNFQWIHFARSARVDMTLAACVAAACIAFERAVAMPLPPPPLMLWSFYLFMGLAALAKGPVGVALPTLTAAAYLLLRRQLGRWRELALVRGYALTAAIPGLWYLLAIAVGGMAFVRKQILRENIVHFLGRGVASANESHPSYYYARELLVGFAPWSVFLLPLAVYLLQGRRRPEVRPYLFPLLWLAVVIGFYTAAASKRGMYILAAYPAAAVLVGAWWSALVRDPAVLNPALRWVLRAAVAVVAAATAAVVLVLLLHAIGLDPIEWIRPLLHRKDQMNLPLVRRALATHWPTALGWGASAALAAWMLLSGARGERWTRVFAALVLYVTATAAATNHAFAPLLADDRTYRPFVADVMRLAGDSDRLFFFGKFDYGAVFYARRHIPTLGNALPTDGTPAFVIFTQREWERLPDTDRARGQLLARSTGTGPEGREPLLLVRLAPTGT